MLKRCVFLVIMMLALSPMWVPAQETQEKLPPDVANFLNLSPQQQDSKYSPKVATFLEAAKNFSQANSSLSGFKAEDYAKDLKDILVGKGDFTVDSKFNPSNYWGMVNDHCTSTETMFNDHTTYPQPNDFLKPDHSNDVATLTKEYFGDLVNGTEADLNYASDYDHLLEKYRNNLKLLNAPPSNAGRFTPTEYLDKSAPGKPIEASLGFAGANDKYVQVSNQYVQVRLRKMIEETKNKYGAYSALQKDLDWVLQSFQESEVDVMEDSSEWSGSSKMKYVGQTYYVNEYGTPDTQNTAGTDFSSLETYSLQDQSFNNRSYGYADGNYSTVKITVGNRTYQLYDHLYTSPIILDLDNDGAIEASHGEWLPHPYNGARLAEFDINGDGFLELTEWVGANDGLLIAYKKGEEVSANNLFGEAGGFINGFEKLSLLDTNGDTQLSGDELKTLSVWQDKNFNAKVDEGEISSVADLGITSISLACTKEAVSSFVQNGETKKSWDWYPVSFRVKKVKETK